MPSLSESAFAFYSAGSGLTPKTNYSLDEHAFAWFKSHGAPSATSLVDAQATVWGPGGEYAYLAARTGSFANLDYLRSLFYASAVIVPTIFGNSGETIQGANTKLVASWMARDSWANLKDGNWLQFNTGYMAAVNANPTWQADVGIPLIPHDMDKTGANWNTLLDLAIANGNVTINSTVYTTDQIYTSMGRAASDFTPAQGTLNARLWWEMNMAPIASNIDRAKFIAAWNRAVPLIRAGFLARAAEQGRTSQKINIVFCPLSDGADYSTFYPAAANVDIVALDVYATIYGSTLPSASALTASVANYLSAFATFGNAKAKPMAIGEWGNWQIGTAGQTTSHGRGDFPAYIDQVFDWGAANKAVYLSYYNINDSNNTGLNFADTPDSLARYQIRSGGTATPYPLKTTAASTISGTATAGSVLTLTPATWNYTPDTVTRQWMKNGAAISGATGTMYTSVTGDIGAVITCVESAVKAKYASATSTSNGITVTAAGVTNFVQDTFTDTTGTLIPPHVGEAGATWTRVASSPAGVSLITANGQARKNNTLGELYYASGTPGSADYSVEATLYIYGTPTVSSAFGVNGRMGTDGQNYYQFRLLWTSAAGYAWVLQKVVGGTATSLVSTPATIANGSSYGMKLTMIGTTIEGWVNGTKVLTTTDTSVTAAGLAGYQHNNSAPGSSDNVMWQFDQFLAHS